VADAVAVTEAANGPTTSEADKLHTRRCIDVIRDVIRDVMA